MASETSSRLFEISATTGRAATQRPLRALAVIPAGSSAASMIFARRQVVSLQRLNVTCETFLLTSRTSPWGLLKEWRRLRRHIRAFKPDLLHAHYGTVTALLSGLSTSSALVVTYRGSDLNPDPSVSRFVWYLRRLLSELAALRADAIVCVSEGLQNRLWWRKTRATVIPTGVDTELFFPRSCRESRTLLQWDPQEKVVLFNAGGHPKIKRPDLAKDAVREASKIFGENIRLAMLNGEMDPTLVPLAMSAADCLLLTSDFEGSPTVVQEAIACNLPVVAVDVGDVRKRLAAVIPSRIVPGNAASLGAALAEIVSRGERSNGCECVSEISNAAIAGQIVSTYRALVCRPCNREE